MEKKSLIISVESRKGGVGKTTAALVLAKFFLQQKFRVLVLDLDLTGTNMLDIRNSPFWKNRTQPVKYNNEEADTLELFYNYFMTKGVLPSFTNSSNSKSELYDLDEKGINIIGSEIFNPKNGINPNKLFDELHSIWFVEFLEQIFLSFKKVYSDSNTVIILDNSPGYVGFVSKIHEWLTDLGPQIGKFLIISSLDKQDLISCAGHIEAIHETFKRKCIISSKVNNVNKSSELESNEIDFYLRLIESEIDSHQLSFYRNIKLNDLCKSFSENPTQYIGFVINKVLDGIKDGVIEYRFNPLLKKYNYFREKDTNRLEKSFFYSRMITFDEYIEYQFILDSLVKEKYLYKKRYSLLRLLSEINIEIKKLRGDPKYHGKNIMLYNVINSKTISSIIKNLSNYQTTFINYLYKLDKNGFSYLTKLFKSKWQPNGISEKLEKIFEELSIDYGYPKNNPYQSRFEDLSIDSLSSKKLSHLIFTIEQQLKEYSDIYFKSSKYIIHEILPQLLISNIIAFYLAGGLRLIYGYENKIEDSIVLQIITLQIEHWMKRKSNKKMTISQFLANEKILKNDVIKYSKKMKKFSNGYYHNFAGLYNEISKVQARILDLQKDYEFLLLVLQRLINQNLEKSLILPYIRGILDKVIVKKNLDHIKGEKALSKELASLEYLEQFQETIEGEVNRWGIN